MRLFKSNEVDDQRYFKIPKSLFGNPNYKGLLPEAKLIYAFLRDRMELSNKNGWINEQGNIYLLFTRTNIAELLEMSLPSITKCFKQLNEYKLIKEVRQGLGKPNIIFIAHIELDKVISQKQTFLMSGNKQSLHQDINTFNANDTDVIETDFNETESIRHFSGKNVCTLSIKGKTLFDFYCRYYEAYTGEQHKPLSDKTISRINELTETLSIFDEETEDSLEVDEDYLKDMVKKYFSNNYNCDRNINHFLNEKILRNLYYQTNTYFYDKVMNEVS